MPPPHLAVAGRSGTVGDMNFLFDTFRRGGFATPRAAFLETVDGGRLTNAELEAASARMANALVRRGVKPGDRVAAQTEKSPEAVVLYLACVRAGAVFLPLNPAYTATELAYFFGDAEPALIVCAPDREAEIRAIAPPYAAVETLGAQGDGSLPALAAEAPATFSDVPRAADDLAAILYTSGTTGRSKGAMLTHANLASNAITLARHWRFTPADVLLHALPIFHTHGLFVAINVTLTAGSSMIWLARFDAPRVLAELPCATTMMGVPTFYVRLLQEPGLTRAATAGVRLFISGSAPLLPDTFRAWRERTGHTILERYGMTETNMNTSNPYDGARVAGTVGPPLPGVEIRVTDPDGAALAPGAIGMIEVKGPNVFCGYWRQPEKTAAEFRADGFFITGDLGRIDERGYVQIVGRGKDLVISGGLNVYPKEVEDEIDAVAGVTESAVIGVPHADFGEGVTAVVVLKPGAATDEAAIFAALAGRLARFKQPKRVLFVDALPRNAMGKVQKSALRERYADLYSVAAASES
jgi:malonyl-CoA/methylmalonyl-CoA synthetase